MNKLAIYDALQCVQSVWQIHRETGHAGKLFAILKPLYFNDVILKCTRYGSAARIIRFLRCTVLLEFVEILRGFSPWQGASTSEFIASSVKLQRTSAKDGKLSADKSSMDTIPLFMKRVHHYISHIFSIIVVWLLTGSIRGGICREGVLKSLVSSRSGIVRSPEDFL